MADDKLNQSDIDALIAKVRGTSPASQPTNDSPELTQFEKLGITENDLKGLTKLFKTSIEASTEVLRSITQKNVIVDSIQEIKVAGRKELSTKITPPYIATKVDYIVGLRGLDVLLMKQPDLNNLMKFQFQSMGYEPDENDTEFIMSASNEVMNQMMGNASNKLGNELGIFIDISTPESQLIEPNSENPEESVTIPFLKEDELSYVYTTFKLNIEGQVSGDLIKVLDASFIEELRTIMHTGNYLDEINGNSSDTNNAGQIQIDDINEENAVAPSSFQASQRTIDSMQQASFDNTQQVSFDNTFDDSQYNMSTMPQQNHQVHQAPTHTPPSNIVQDSSVEVRRYELPFINTVSNLSHEIASTNRIKSVQVEMAVELGRTRMTVKDILELDKGSIIELNTLAGEQLNLYCNGTLIAKGEVVVIKDNFAFRVLSIVEQDYR